MTESRIEILIDGQIVHQANFPAELTPIETQHALAKMAGCIILGALCSGRAWPVIDGLDIIASSELTALSGGS